MTRLGERESEVLRLALLNLSTKEIAKKMGIRPRTVKMHLGNIFKKKKVKNRRGLGLKYGIDLYTSKYGNLIGKTFGWLTVEARSDINGVSRRLFWKCKCKCGNYVTLEPYTFANGGQKSCGCAHFKKNAPPMKMKPKVVSEFLPRGARDL